MEPPQQRPDFHLGAVILAAGGSTRMGSHKLLLAWGDSTIASHHLATWIPLASQVAFVVAEHDEALQSELGRLGVHPENTMLNPHPERGMFSSLQCAAEWTGWNSGLTHFVIILGDQPQLDSAAVLRPLLQFARDHSNAICQPALHGRPKHPVVLPRPAMEELRDAPDVTLKGFLARRPVELCAMSEEALNIDLDYPEEYERNRPGKLHA
jgi:molybdenum cofactor cytidylyltransferase